MTAVNEWLKNEPIGVISEKEAWVLDSCRGLADEALSDCQFKHSVLWELDDKWSSVLIGVVVIVTLYLFYRNRAAIVTTLGNALVNGVAATIKGKRLVENRLTDAKNRIADKANE
ncbi:hypothetical protein GFPCMMHI_02597 [Ensifer adhaerens]|nr:hypothetical protein [Ensifer adhaerens]